MRGNERSESYSSNMSATGPLTFHFADDGAVPNNALPMLVYKGAIELGADPEAAIERAFAANGWGHGQWRDGIYPFVHYHSMIHEALGIARGRARVRGLALIAAADGHPLVVPRIRAYLEKALHLEEEKRNGWLMHWTLEALKAIEAQLQAEKETVRYCHGNSVSMADICLAGQVIAATGYFKCDVTAVPTAMRIYEECMKLEAFSNAHPLKPGILAS